MGKLLDLSSADSLRTQEWARHRTTSRGRHRRKDRGDRGRRGRDRPKPEVVVRAAGAHTAGQTYDLSQREPSLP